MVYYFIIIALWLFGSANNGLKPIYNLNGDINGYGKKNDGRLSYVIWGMLPLLLIMGLRSAEVGIDLVSYVNRYENAEEMMGVASTASEMGFNYFNLLLSKFELSWQGYLIICTIFLIIGLSAFLHKYSSDIFYSLFIYMTIGLFSMNMSGIRQSLAISICLMALVTYEKLFREKKLKAYICFYVLVFVAITFHNSALIFVIVPFLTSWRFTKKQCLFMLIVASAAIFYKNFITGALPSFEGTRYSDFTFDQEYAINPLVIAFTIVIPLISLYYIPTQQDGRFSNKMSLMFIFASLNVFFTILSINNNQLGRVGYYFIPCDLVLLPAMIASLNGSERTFVKIVTTLVCIVYFILGAIGGTLHIDNYTFFWQQ